jgi:hypothetical protein
MKKDYYLIIDTETTMSEKVADFGAVVVDRKGNIQTQCGVLVNGVFGIDALFYINGEKENSLWSKQGKDRRFDKYNEMLENGTRMLASVNAINNWLNRVAGKYNPILTAYNLPFDMDKCQKTGIDLTMFENSFCMWRVAFNKYAMTKSYKNFAMQIHAINPPTKKGNCSFQTNAEVMTKFVTNNPELVDEPHTALEDVIYYELLILKNMLKNMTKSELLENDLGFDWRKVQLKNHFKAV